MALIMNRHIAPNGAPPLPARPGQSGPHVKTGRSQSMDHSVHHVRMMHQFSVGSIDEHNRTQDDVPMRGNPIRRDFETRSFIDRNTAKAFSNPSTYKGGAGSNPPRRQVDHVVYPVDENLPPPPPIASLPPRRMPSSAGDRKKPTSAEPPPPPLSSPPGRKDTPPISPLARPPKADSGPGRPPKSFHGHHGDSGPAIPPKSLSIQPERPPKTKVKSPRGQEPSPGRPTMTSPGAQEITPPGRPPKNTRRPSIDNGSDEINPSMYDLERRFCFHDINEFPNPEPMAGITKTRPSMTQSMKRQHQKEKMGYL